MDEKNDNDKRLGELVLKELECKDYDVDVEKLRKTRKTYVNHLPSPKIAEVYFLDGENSHNSRQIIVHTEYPKGVIPPKSASESVDLIVSEAVVIQEHNGTPRVVGIYDSKGGKLSFWNYGKSNYPKRMEARNGNVVARLLLRYI